MKKLTRILSAALCLLITLSACGLKDTSVSREKREKKEDKEITSSVSVSQEVEPEEEPEKVEEEEPMPFLLYSPTLNELLWMSENGELISIKHTGSITGNIVATDDRYVFTALYDEDSYTDEKLLVYDAVTEKTTEIATIAYMDYIDIYNDKVYITTHDWSANYYSTIVFDETTYEMLYIEDTFINEIQGFRIINPEMPLYRNKMCNERLLDEFGFVIVSDSEGYYTYEGNGFVKIDMIPSRYTNIVSYNDGYVIYSQYDPNTYESKGLFSYNFNTDEIIQIANGQGMVISLDKDNVIFYEKTSEEYGMYTYRVYKMNLLNYEKKLLVLTEKTPGIDDYSAGYDGFKIANGRIYYVADNGLVKDWWYVDKDSCVYPMNIHDDKPSWSELASLEYISSTVYCPVCNEAIGKYYDEYPVINKKVSPEYEKINAYLKEECESGCSYFMNEDVCGATSEEECEWYAHGTSIGCTTYDGGVSAIYCLGTKYLYIETNGYWYGGGAHGYPVTATYLFNTETGDKITFGDIYEGTEEEFKTLIATKTAEYAQTFDEEDTPFFNPDYDEVYERAYEHASLEHACLWMSHVGLIYYFEPYYLGSYAAGYIMVPLTLEDVELENVLN